MRGATRVVLLSLIVSTAFPLQLIGQSVGIGAKVVSVRLSRETAAGLEQPKGTAFGIEGVISSSRFGLNIRYYEGSISTPAAGSDQDIVEGEAMVWFRPVRWLSLVIGPHVRSLVTTRGTERWLFLEARLHSEVSLLGPIRGYADGWRVLAADVNVAEPFDNGYGIDGGLTLSLGALPLAFALRYRNESATLAGGARLETIEQLAIVVGYGRF